MHNLRVPSQAKPTLEGIPIELLIQILFQIPDRSSLKSVVLSSPKLYQAYAAIRQDVLCCVLKTQYGSLLDLPEAITAVRSKGLSFQSHKEEAIALLDIWRRKIEIRRLSQAPLTQIDKPGSLEEILELFHLYEELHFFLEDFAKNAPRPMWMDATRWHGKILPIGLSDDEKRRFLRALCRLQILANIFGLPERDLLLSGKDNNWRNISNDIQAYRLFYGTMPPWEHEEMGSIWSYLESKYEPICRKISDDLRNLARNNDCYRLCDIIPEEQRPPVGGDMEDVTDLNRFNEQFERLTAIGPGFLYRVLHAEPLTQRNMIMANVRIDTLNIFIGTELGVSWDDRLPLIYPADRHESPGFEHLWSTLPAIEQPNLGWKKNCLLPHTADQELEDVLDFDREAEKDWEWGYAIWDDERLQEWNAPLQQQDRLT